MNDSILVTIKQMLGLTEDYDAFDTDILVDINSVMLTLHQLGIGPEAGFTVTSTEEKWGDLLGTDDVLLKAAQQYIFLKVRLIFDPPSASAHIDTMNKAISELEWRLTLQAEN